MKNNILDITFTIPVRIDNEQRLRNFKLVKNYLQKYFFVNILVGESSSEPVLKNICSDCGYIYYKNTSNVFHRTKILNDLARASSTVFIVNYDCDVLLQPAQITKAVNILRGGNADLVLPYNGMARNIINRKIPTFEKSLSLYTINDSKDTYEMNSNACGGALFWNKRSFINFGMENQNFIDWGCEDNERMIRAMKLNLGITRVHGNLYHLEHPRNDDVNAGQQFYKQNVAELTKINKISKTKLVEYIKTWQWLK